MIMFYWRTAHHPQGEESENNDNKNNPNHLYDLKKILQIRMAIFVIAAAALGATMWYNYTRPTPLTEMMTDLRSTLPQGTTAQIVKEVYPQPSAEEIVLEPVEEEVLNPICTKLEICDGLLSTHAISGDE